MNRNHYYWYSPRGFVNEYDVIATRTAAEEAQLLGWGVPEGARLERVTVRELHNMAAEERQARKYDQAFSGYCAPWAPLTVDEFLHPVL